VDAAVHFVGITRAPEAESAASRAGTVLARRVVEVIDMVSAYRTDDALGERIAELLRDRRREAATLDAAARSVLVRRTGRAAAGAVGIAGGLLLLVVAAGRVACRGAGWYFPGQGDLRPGGLLSAMLVGTWAAMGLAYVVGRLAGHAQLDVTLWGLLALTGDRRDDLARLRSAGSRRSAVVEQLDRVLGPSIGWHLAAMGLLLPLTLHLGVWLALSGGRFRDFDGWICVSAVSVGIAHLVLAGKCALLPKALREPNGAPPEDIALAEGWRAFGLAVAAACVPGILWFLIPPLLTAVTGVAFIPLMFHLAGKRLARERTTLASLQEVPAGDAGS
jgi:hypothetical protein